MAEIPRGGVEEVDAAVAAAKAAFPAWRAVAPADRAMLLHRLADAIGAESEDLATLEARNAGKPISDARGEIGMVADCFRYYAAAPERLVGRTIPVAGGVDLTFREPMGVVGLIVPWNFPLVITSWKAAPALAAGNTVVLKPAELTPLTAIELERIALEAGLPEGVLNVVVGPGSVCGTAPGRASRCREDRLHRLDRGRAGHRAGRRGDDQAGRRSSSVASRPTSCSRTPTSRPPAAPPRAACSETPGRTAAPGRASWSRRRRWTSSWPRWRRRSSEMRVGDPLSDETEMGPLISADQRETVGSFVTEEDVAFRGSAPDGEGFWFPPTVLAPMTNDDRASREEIFGPVACVIPFSDEAEAIRLANDTIYGLSGSIWTRDGGRALRVARAIDTGVLSINSHSSVRVSTPFGGFKQSGYGRELGPDALDAYTDVKNVYYRTEE